MTLDAIWLTHAHIDHIGAIAGVRRVFDVPVLLHPRDLPYYRELSARAAQMYGIDFEQPDGPDAELTEGQELRCGDLRFTVMHVPGHAPGLVALQRPRRLVRRRSSLRRLDRSHRPAARQIRPR